MLMIRLARVGARKQPHYRVVVIEKARARNGRPVEVVGTYNPRTNPTSIDLKRERIDVGRRGRAMGVRWKWSGLIIPAPIPTSIELKRERIDTGCPRARSCPIV